MNKQAIKIYVFYCSNGIEPQQLTAGIDKLEGAAIKTISLPCSGKIDVPYLVKAFETGADGAAIVTCKQNECQHLEGNLRANKRAEAVESLLEEIGMGKGRMAVIMLKDGGVEQAIAEIRSFIDRVKKLPKSQKSSANV
ncbi:MAG: hydrogenase iron-sulfur subunit [Sedimentisphaerales bacterium]|jgi:coenzyme F420-reducing hydrogenase delta subunit